MKKCIIATMILLGAILLSSSTTADEKVPIAGLQAQDGYKEVARFYSPCLIACICTNISGWSCTDSGDIVLLEVCGEE